MYVVRDSIFCMFLKKIAGFWEKMSRYHIFVILAATAMLTIPLLFGKKSNDTIDSTFNVIIFCSAAVGGFLLLKSKGSQMAAFTFATALLLRICLVFVFECSAPLMQDDVRTKTAPWTRHYDTVLFAGDEFFYVYCAQRYRDVTVSEFINSPELTDNEYRVGFLISRLFRFFGDGFIWYRIIGAFLGAFAAAILCLAAQRLFGKETSAIVSLLAALAPQTAFYSVRFLKEVWVIFAVSIMVFGFVMLIRNKKLLSAVLSITAASAILLWMRFEYGLMFIATIPIAVCFRNKGNPAGKIVAVLSMILLGAIIFAYQFNQLTHKAEGLLNKYTMTEKEQSGRLEAMDRIYKSRGAARLFNIPLAILNPPPKNLDHIFMPENGLWDIVLQADIYQWWLPLPFLIIGGVIIIGRRREFLPFLPPYIMAISASALLIGGLLPGVYRYRDSLAPIAFVIIGAGIESFMAEKKIWKNGVIIAVYTVFILLAIYFYARDY